MLWVFLDSTLWWIYLDSTESGRFVLTVVGVFSVLDSNLYMVGFFGLSILCFVSMDCNICGGFVWTLLLVVYLLDYSLCCGFVWTVLFVVGLF